MSDPKEKAEIRKQLEALAAQVPAPAAPAAPGMAKLRGTLLTATADHVRLRVGGGEAEVSAADVAEVRELAPATAEHGPRVELTLPAAAEVRFGRTVSARSLLGAAEPFAMAQPTAAEPFQPEPPTEREAAWFAERGMQIADDTITPKIENTRSTMATHSWRKVGTGYGPAFSDYEIKYVADDQRQGVDDLYVWYVYDEG